MAGNGGGRAWVGCQRAGGVVACRGRGTGWRVGGGCGATAAGRMRVRGLRAGAGDHHLRVAVLLTGDWHAAEDLVQASLVKLYRVWPRLDTGTDPDAYLRRVMVNTQRSWWRARWRREVPAAQLPEGMSGDDIADRQAVGALVRQALAGLPRQQRAVLVLRYCEDLSEAEVAEILGCSVGTVKTHAHRGVAALRERLGGEFGRLDGEFGRLDGQLGRREFGRLEVNETGPSRRDSG
jgi:RNA polymerase sigma-70 factor (sigma-E family)